MAVHTSFIFQEHCVVMSTREVYICENRLSIRLKKPASRILCHNYRRDGYLYHLTCAHFLQRLHQTFLLVRYLFSV